MVGEHVGCKMIEDRLRAELADALQCASVEAGLRREAHTANAAKDARIADAQQDCADARSALRETEEELVATAEDLKAANARIAKLGNGKAGWEVEGFIDRLTRRDNSNSERLVLEAISHIRGFSQDCDALRARAEKAEADLKEWICCAEDRRKDRDKAEAKRDASREALAQIERRTKNAINVQNPTSVDNFIKEIGAMARAALNSAGRDTLREALEMSGCALRVAIVYINADDHPEDFAYIDEAEAKVRAALNPSPAGREGDTSSTTPSNNSSDEPAPERSSPA